VQVKYLDLPRQFQDEGLRKTILAQLDACQFVMGPEVERLESNFARLCRTPFALGVNSGTDAIFLALKALRIGEGDEVITPPNSFLATAGAIIAAGARPTFVDVAEDYNIDAGLIESVVTPRTRAILPVHLTGNPADMARIMEIAERRGLYVVEDAAQAIAASVEGQPVGSFGDAGCFSLHPLKNLNAAGDGGVLTTKSEEIAHSVRLMRNHGLKNRDEIEFFAYNSRLDSIQAAVVNYVMQGLEEVTRKRIAHAGLYDERLSRLAEFVTLPPRRKNVRQVFHTYVIRAKRRDELIVYLANKGVETKVHYPIPIHLQKPCREMGWKEGDFPVCERQAREILSLPVHQHLGPDQIAYVADQIALFYGASN
jgi:dTDP-4-amino-4,6-dideoxygalactose transaminase